MYNENSHRFIGFLEKETDMDFLQNPNVAYLLLAGGLVFAVLALAAPGTGVLEIGRSSSWGWLDGAS